MIEFEKPNIHKVEETDSYGKFVVEPLERGYGTTLGNSLRRVLLASLPGAAITSIKIDGVLHEFSTVEGVTEDVTQIILNLKKVSLKLDSEEQKDLEIDVKGPAEVTAGDIQGDGEVEVLNPDLYIATVADGAELHIKMTADKGRGYFSAMITKLEWMISQLVYCQLTPFIPRLNVLTTQLKMLGLVNVMITIS